MNHLHIKTKGVSGEKKREFSILQEIRTNPTIHHNALKDRIVPKHMATKTFDKTIKSLIDRSVIEVVPMGDNKKHYALHEIQLESFKEDFQQLRSRYVNLVNFIKETVVVSNKFTPFQRATMLTNCIKWICKEFNLLLIMNTLEPLKKNHHNQLEQGYRQLLAEVVKIILLDPDRKIIFPMTLEEIFGLFELHKLSQKEQ